MNINPAMVDQLLNHIPYPIGKNDLVNIAKQRGANDQVTNLLDRLPDKTYNNADEIKGDFGGVIGKLGNIGNIGNIGGGLKP
jgi:hypothetical protein